MQAPYCGPLYLPYLRLLSSANQNMTAQMLYFPQCASARILSPGLLICEHSESFLRSFLFCNCASPFLRTFACFSIPLLSFAAVLPSQFCRFELPHRNHNLDVVVYCSILSSCCRGCRTCHSLFFTYCDFQFKCVPVPTLFQGPIYRDPARIVRGLLAGTKLLRTCCCCLIACPGSLAYVLAAQGLSCVIKYHCISKLLDFLLIGLHELVYQRHS